MCEGVCGVCRYFELFDVVSELSAKERLSVLQAAARCASPEETGTVLVYTHNYCTVMHK